MPRMECIECGAITRTHAKYAYCGECGSAKLRPAIEDPPE